MDTRRYVGTELLHQMFLNTIVIDPNLVPGGAGPEKVGHPKLLHQRSLVAG